MKIDFKGEIRLEKFSDKGLLIFWEKVAKIALKIANKTN